MFRYTCVHMCVKARGKPQVMFYLGLSAFCGDGSLFSLEPVKTVERASQRVPGICLFLVAL